MSLARALLEESETIRAPKHKIRLELANIVYKDSDKEDVSLVATIKTLYQEAQCNQETATETFRLLVLGVQKFSDSVRRYRCEIRPEEQNQTTLTFAKKALVDLWLLESAQAIAKNLDSALQSKKITIATGLRLTRRTIVYQDYLY